MIQYIKSNNKLTKIIIKGIEKTITIPNDIIELGPNSLNIDENCDNPKFVSKLVIPSSIKKVSDSTFFGFMNLREIVLERGSPCFHLSKGILFSKDLTKVYLSTTKIKSSVKIPKGTQEIFQGAFENRKSLTKIVFPNSLERIGNFSFYGCEKLKKVAMPEELTSFGKSSFCCCFKLTEFSIPSRIKELPDSLFLNCKKLSKVKILGNTLKTVQDFAFNKCESLEEIIFNSSCNSLNDGAFLNCTKLKKVTIPNPNMVINKKAFLNCPMLSLEGKKNSTTEKFCQKYKINFIKYMKSSK